MIILETQRLILRELELDDVAGMFELDSDKLVHKYLGETPITTMEQASNTIEVVRKQYVNSGIGRWATIEKLSGNFIGWSGLKFITETENNQVNFYDVGYRLIPKYWGKGYATEAAKAALQYGFTTMNLQEIIGSANVENKASRKALEKCGLKFVEQFYWKNIHCDWLKINKEEWKNRL